MNYKTNKLKKTHKITNTKDNQDYLLKAILKFCQCY